MNLTLHMSYAVTMPFEVISVRVGVGHAVPGVGPHTSELEVIVDDESTSEKVVPGHDSRMPVTDRNNVMEDVRLILVVRVVYEVLELGGVSKW